MKIKPKIYAELLLETLSSVISSHPEPAGGRIEGGEKSHDTSNKFYPIAKGFWYLLQKNKQYRDLPKILDELEKVYAEKEGFVIAYVESGKELNEAELEEIKRRLQNVIASHRVEREARQSDEKIASSQAPRNDERIIIKTRTNPSVTGIVAKIDGKVIDLSVEDKIAKLRKTFSRNG